eukprot:4980825-Pyramimonas_sp.AAC.1
MYSALAWVPKGAAKSVPEVRLPLRKASRHAHFALSCALSCECIYYSVAEPTAEELAEMRERAGGDASGRYVATQIFS